MNATIEKFGYPATLLHEWEHWVVLVRPAQPTLGSLVLAAKSTVTQFPDLPAAAFIELQTATASIERALRAFTDCARINYLMLMMVDPHVHFHVIPRYEGTREFDGAGFRDAGWPKVPDLPSAVSLTEAQIENLREALSPLFA